jgi:hypothetical protein
VPLGDDAAAELLSSVPEEARGGCWWLVLRDGTPVPGDGGGGALLLAELRPTRPLRRLWRTRGAARLVDVLDRLAARHRGGSAVSSRTGPLRDATPDRARSVTA